MRTSCVCPPETIKDSLSALHPASPYRFVLMKQTIAEIEQKQARGEALVPEGLPLNIQPASGKHNTASPQTISAN